MITSVAFRFSNRFKVLKSKAQYRDIMNRSRAYRRSQMDRAKNRAIRFLHIVGETPTQQLVSLYAGQRKPCSCRMCRNARWLEGPTRKERMSAI